MSTCTFSNGHAHISSALWLEKGSDAHLHLVIYLFPDVTLDAFEADYFLKLSHKIKRAISFLT